MILLYPPRATKFLLAGIGLYYAVSWLAGAPGRAALAVAPGVRELATVTNFGANVGPLVAAGELWRLVVSIFLHAGLLHLLVNAYALFLLGSNVEAFYGPWRFLFLFLLSGVVGSAASALLSRGISMGASGGIFGLLGGSIVFAYRYRHVLPRRVKRIMGPALLPWVAINIALGILVPRIDMNAHMGGLLAGAVTALWLRPESLERPLRGARNATSRFCAAVSLSILTVSFAQAGANIFRMRGENGPLLDPRVAALAVEDREGLLGVVAEVLRHPEAMAPAGSLLPLLDGALRESPEDFELRMARALLRAKEGRWLGAIEDYRAILAGAPEHVVALNNLAWLLLEEVPEELRSFSEAERLAARALALAPEDPFVLGTYGTVLLRRGRPGEAAAYLGRALEARRPASASATDRYLLAIALARSGRRGQARRELERAVREDPRNLYRIEAESELGEGTIQSEPAP